MTFMQKPPGQEVVGFYSRWGSSKINICLFLHFCTNSWFIWLLENYYIWESVHKWRIIWWHSEDNTRYNLPNTSSVVTHEDFGSLSTDDPKEDSYYIDPYNIQDNVIIDEIIITIGEQVANACNLSRLIHG